MPVTRSSPACTLLNSGMLTSMMANTTANSTGMATAYTSAHFTSMVNAIIIAPNTTNGLLNSSRSPMFTPFCTWLMSSVRRVIIVSEPRVSSSVNDRRWIWSNTA